MSMNARLYRWNELQPDAPMANITRRRVIGDKMMISKVELGAGFSLESHRHENEQFVLMISGRAVFGLGEPGTAAFREIEVRAGDVLHLPGNVPHSCRAIEPCEILDLFSPVSATTGVDHHASSARAG